MNIVFATNPLMLRIYRSVENKKREIILCIRNLGSRCDTNIQKVSKDDIRVLGTRNPLRLSKRIYESNVKLRENKSFVGKLKKIVLNSIHDDEKFTAFIPHLLFDSLIYLCNMDRCENVVLVEEGDISYGDKNDLLQDRTYFEEFINKNMVCRKLSLENALDNITTAYSLSESSLEWVQNHNIVPVKKIFTKNSSIKEHIKGGVFILIGAFPYYGWVDADDYLVDLKRMITSLPCKKFIKLHPNFYTRESGLEDIIMWLKKYEKKNSNMNLVNYDVEEVLGSVPDLNIILLKSSVSRYAHMISSNVYSWFANISEDKYDEDFLIKAREEYNRSKCVSELQKNI